MDKKTFAIGAGAFAGAFCATAIFMLGGCGHRGNTIAVVNGDRLGTDEFYQYLANKPEVSVVTENGSTDLPVQGTLGFQAMRDLIDHQIELQIAKDKGVYPTPEQVERRLKLRLQNDPNFILNLEARGVPLDMIRKSLTFDLANENLLTQGIHLTTDQVKAYVAAHPAQFMEPAKADIDVVFVRTPGKKDEVDRELASGQSFDAVALRYSEAQTARAYNGKLTDPNEGPTILQTLPADVQTALAKLGEQESTGWIMMDGGFAKLYIEKRYAQKKTVFDAAKIELLRHELMVAEGKRVHDIAKMITDKLRHSKVDVVAEQYRDDWRTAMEELRSAQ